MFKKNIKYAVKTIKNFFENNKVIIIADLILAFIIWCVGSLYGIESEFIFYEVVFIILIGVISCFINNSSIKKKTKDIDIPEDTEKDRKWERLREKEDFFVLWAHQIKTPIAAMRLLLQDEEVNSGACKRELIRIESYVDMALNYIRFEDMSGDLVLENYDLEKMVKQVVKKFSTIFIHQHLSIELKDLEGRILTDEKWFCFVLEQVLSNALKYTKEGGIKIYTREALSGREIIISDTGIGVRSEDLPRVFEKGYTGYNGRMDKKASGIGLYLCKGICEKLGHGIRMESREGEGTDVIITVPCDNLIHSDLTKM